MLRLTLFWFCKGWGSTAASVAFKEGCFLRSSSLNWTFLALSGTGSWSLEALLKTGASMDTGWTNTFLDHKRNRIKSDSLAILYAIKLRSILGTDNFKNQSWLVFDCFVFMTIQCVKWHLYALAALSKREEAN